MIIVMRMGAENEQLETVLERIRGLGFKPHISSGEERTIVGVIGNDRPIDGEVFESLDGVERVVHILKPYKLASRDFTPDDTVVQVGPATIGGGSVAIMAGPCSVEDREQMFRIAEVLAGMGVKVLRGGAFKPRTSPYSFQGLGEEGLRILAEVRERYGMAVVTEVMSEHEVDLVEQYADMLQIGTRNMQNYRLLAAVGRQRRPVLLKRGMSATVDEWLQAAEYVLSQGNPNVVLCERGIRTFETATRSTCDINAVPLLRSLSHLPIIVDPSHATGRADLVGAVGVGCVAAGADGLIVEVHTDPAQAVSDAAQTLSPEQFADLLDGCGRVTSALGRTLDLADAASRA